MDTRERLTQTDAKLHWLFLPGATGSAASYDTILNETEHFAVLPTKGSIVPGWMLVVPKFPIGRMADIPTEQRAELNSLVGWVWRKIELEFGTAFSFEHGGYRGSKISCGVDQAHLHIAPLPFDLLEAARNSSIGSWQRVDACAVPSLNFMDREYWFASSGEVTICKPVDHPQSQFFRKVIANKLGIADLWNYKGQDFLENVERTIEAIGVNG